ncbi:MAG TPA: hypothetical protein VKU83_05260 [Puia sp.]|nr:hypothetical protein [Puia sp.]
MMLPKRYVILAVFVASSALLFYLLFELLFHIFLSLSSGGPIDVGAGIAAMACSGVGGVVLLILSSAIATVIYHRRGKKELEKGFLYSLWFSLLLVVAVLVGWYML